MSDTIKILGQQGLTLFDQLIKQNYTESNVTTEQIDNLFPAILEPDPIPTVKSFSTATNEEITEIINAYYNGLLSLEDIQEIWHVGDKRVIHIDAMAATGVSESHHADDYEYTIIDFEHDLLAEPVNGKTKALLTLQQDRIFYKNVTDTNYTSSFPSMDDEGGYMNDTGSASTGWNGSLRRTWCNEVYYNALPAYIKSLIKTVYKSTANTDDSANPIWIANTDKCWLLSELEVFGGRPYGDSVSAEKGTNDTHYINGTSGDTITMPSGGTQYPYFDSSEKRYKLPVYDSYVSATWSLRSPWAHSSGSFGGIGVDGEVGAGFGADVPYGIAPAFSI